LRIRSRRRERSAPRAEELLVWTALEMMMSNTEAMMIRPSNASVPLDQYSRGPYAKHLTCAGKSTII
jgi:hypothetical protein